LKDGVVEIQLRRQRFLFHVTHSALGVAGTGIRAQIRGSFGFVGLIYQIHDEVVRQQRLQVGWELVSARVFTRNMVAFHLHGR